MNCGREHESRELCAICDCDKSMVVHQLKCDGCGHILGFLCDDPYCGANYIYCHECVDKARKVSNETPVVTDNEAKKECLQEDQIKSCKHEFVFKEYLSQPYGTCAVCGQTVLYNKDH